MDKDQLKDFLNEMVVFLGAIDKVLPNRIDGEMMEWLKSVIEHSWHVEMILKLLGNKSK